MVIACAATGCKKSEANETNTVVPPEPKTPILSPELESRLRYQAQNRLHLFGKSLYSAEDHLKTREVAGEALLAQSRLETLKAEIEAYIAETAKSGLMSESRCRAFVSDGQIEAINQAHERFMASLHERRVFDAKMQLSRLASEMAMQIHLGRILNSLEAKSQAVSRAEAALKRKDELLVQFENEGLLSKQESHDYFREVYQRSEASFEKRAP